MRSIAPRMDLNPILDEGAPTSTGGILNAAALCDALGRELVLDPPREEYYHSWGSIGADPKPIVAAWSMVVNDVENRPTVIEFDLVRGESPLIMGLDIKRYADTVNSDSPSWIRFKRPCDTRERKFFTYIDNDETGNRRLRIEIVPHKEFCHSSLLGGMKIRFDKNAIKRIHRFTHAPAKEIKSILNDAGVLNEELSDYCEEVHNSCDICASSGRPAHRKKVSITHVNEEFNVSVSADFLVAYIGEHKFEIINIVDMGTNYGERTIVSRRTADEMKHKLETDWLYHHGAPQEFSADPEFTTPTLKRFLKSHAIEVKERPSRSSSKNGKVERNNGLFKLILSRIARENTCSPPQTLVARASFLTNLFHGNSTLSSFQLARGYSPSLLGVPAAVVPPDVLAAHKHTVASRALQKVLKSHNNSTHSHQTLKKGSRIWVYYNTSKQNEPVRWIKATVLDSTPFLVRCRRSKKGPPMSVAHEHIRVAPDGELAQELQEGILEDVLSDFSVINENRSKQSTVNSVEQKSSREAKPRINEKNQKRSFFTKKVVGNYALDIGKTDISSRLTRPTLQSDEQHILSKFYGIVGKSQITRKSMEGLPSWIIQNAINREIEQNWTDAYEEVKETDVPRNANVISSHIVYALKSEENNTKRLKARLCPHGNRDQEKGNIRTDSSNAQFMVIRLLISLSTILNFTIGCVDIQGAYMQSGPITRELYVRPPREIRKHKGILWRLLKLPYGIPEAGRQWAKTIENWLLNEMNFERIIGVGQLYVKRDRKLGIELILVKLTDDLLISGAKNSVIALANAIRKRFTTRKFIVGEEIRFNGCILQQQENGDVTLCMQEYLDNIDEIQLSKPRQANKRCKAAHSEISSFRKLAGELIWIGGGALPQASYVGSLMQQRVPDLLVEHIIQANRTLKTLKHTQPIIRFKRPPGEIIAAEVVTFSDASFGITPNKTYGQTGIISGIRYRTDLGDATSFHLIDWNSSKQRRVTYSSYGSEILACADADDRGFNIKSALCSLFPKIHFKHVINVDSKALFDTITTLHEGKEYRLRQTVQGIRDSFESNDIDMIRWVQGNANIADALTKLNPHSSKLLYRTAKSGTLLLPNHKSFGLNSLTWT